MNVCAHKVSTCWSEKKNHEDFSFVTSYGKTFYSHNPLYEQNCGTVQWDLS